MGCTFRTNRQSGDYVHHNTGCAGRKKTWPQFAEFWTTEGTVQKRLKQSKEPCVVSFQDCLHPDTLCVTLARHTSCCRIWTTQQEPISPCGAVCFHLRHLLCLIIRMRKPWESRDNSSHTGSMATPRYIRIGRIAIFWYDEHVAYEQQRRSILPFLNHYFAGAILWLSMGTFTPF